MKGFEVAQMALIALTVIILVLLIKYANDKFGILKFPDSDQNNGGTDGGSNHITPGDSGQLACIMKYAKNNILLGKKCGCGDSCEEYAGWIVQYSNQYDVPQLIVLSVMMQESSCGHYGSVGYGTYCDGVKKSSAGAVGLMQVMPKTGKADCGYEIADLCDPQKNIECGIRVLRAKYNKCVKEGHGTWEAALSAYRIGPCTGSSTGAGYAKLVNDRYAQLGTVAANQCSIV